MIKDENFITIQGWMINKLNLTGNDLLVYAIIYGFSQDSNSTFKGSQSYLAEWCNSTTRGIRKNLNNLLDMGLIQEINHPSGGLVEYQTTPEQSSWGVGTKFLGGRNKVPGTQEQSSYNNIDNNIDNKIDNILTQATLASEIIPKEESDFNSHAYQEETPKERYKRQKAEKKQSDYQSHAYQEERLTVKDACKEYINKFTDNESLREILIDYLDVRTSIKDKPLSLRTWQGMLAKLKTLDGDMIEIVKQSIRENWASFYSERPTKSRNVTDQSWDRNVTSDSMTKEDYDKMQAFLEEKRKNGERTVF